MNIECIEISEGVYRKEVVYSSEDVEKELQRLQEVPSLLGEDLYI